MTVEVVLFQGRAGAGKLKHFVAGEQGDFGG